jgi:lysozyme
MYTRHFTDLSSNTQSFNAEQYARGGALLVGNKATEGFGYVNPTYAPRTRDAHTHKLCVMHYHFGRCDLGSSGNQEARAFHNAVKGLWRPGDIWCLDQERETGHGVQIDNNWVVDFYRQARALFGADGITYTNRDYLMTHGVGAIMPGGRWWEADYSNTPNLKFPNVWTWARQFTDGSVGPEPHSMPGVGRCDVSTLNRRTFGRLVARRLLGK